MAKKQVKKKTTTTPKKTNHAKDLDESMPYIFATHTRRVVCLLIGALLLILGIIWVANVDGNTEQKATNTHSHNEAQMINEAIAAHDHSSYYMVDQKDAPVVEVFAEEDAVKGWNIVLKTNNFKFTPENVNKDNVAGEGHAHLYVDGQKVARLYGPNYHYGVSFDGEREFTVTLNANDHSQYMIKGGEPIESALSVFHAYH